MNGNRRIRAPIPLPQREARVAWNRLANAAERVHGTPIGEQAGHTALLIACHAADIGMRADLVRSLKRVPKRDRRRIAEIIERLDRNIAKWQQVVADRMLRASPATQTRQ